MVKTLVQPVYRYLIGTNNDLIIECFTARMLSETDFKGSSEGYMISNVMQWNPRKNYKNDPEHSSDIHIECKKC